MRFSRFFPLHFQSCISGFKSEFGRSPEPGEWEDNSPVTTPRGRGWPRVEEWYKDGGENGGEDGGEDGAGERGEF